MSDTLTIKELLNQSTASLKEAGTGSELDAQILLGAAVGQPREFLYAWPETPVSDQAQRELEANLERRLRGEPLAYITGWREFWTFELAITPDVLVPRPETEQLVSLSLEHVDEVEPSIVVDVGTGSGAIALAIGSERSTAHVIGIDTSEACIEVARANAVRLDIDNVELREGHLLETLDIQADVIVSNPPYVANDDPALLGDGVRFEPPLALCGGDDGLDVIRELVATAPQHLTQQGWLLIEHGMDQGNAVRDIMSEAFSDVRTVQDLSGLDRVTMGAVA